MKNYVSGLALLEGGATQDIIRHGTTILWPGKTLLAKVINPDPRFSPDMKQLIAEGWVPVNEDVEPIFALTVIDDDGHEIESVAIQAWSGYVSSTSEESELFEPGVDAPDYIIQSFFRRYFLDHGQVDESEITD